MALAHEAGGRIEFVDEPGLVYAPEDDMAETMAFLSGINNRRYSRNLRRNVTDAHTIRASNGVIGKTCWGYLIEGEKYSKRLVPTDECRIYAPQIFKMIAAGKSCRQVAAWLDSEGVKTSTGLTKWNEGAVHQIATNRTYAGRRVNAAGVTMHMCEAAREAARPHRGRPV